VVAGLFSSGKWAVVLSIAVGGHGVIFVLSRIARLDTFLGSLAGWFSDREAWEELRIILSLVLGNS
jgi:hypothetical protein